MQRWEEIVLFDDSNISTKIFSITEILTCVASNVPADTLLTRHMKSEYNSHFSVLKPSWTVPRHDTKSWIRIHGLETETSNICSVNWVVHCRIHCGLCLALMSLYSKSYLLRKMCKFVKCSIPKRNLDKRVVQRASD